MGRDNELKQLQELAHQWETGSSQAGNGFVERIQPLVRYHVRNLRYERFASRVDVNDLTQIVLQKISEVAGRGDLGDKVTAIFYAWLQRFVKNTVTREVRNHCAQKRDWRRQAQFDESTNDRGQDNREASDLKIMVDEVIRNLSTEERELALQLANGNSQAEIAAAMNVHPRTVRRRIAALRISFSECGLEASVN